MEGYTLERSLDGQIFDSIHFQMAVGKKYSKIEYEHLDEKLAQRFPENYT